MLSRYPLEQYGSKYIMLYSGFINEREIRCVWLAHSKDAEHWTQLKTPLVEPATDENEQLYCPALFLWQNRNFIVYADRTSVRGGKIKYVEVDRELNPMGSKGERLLLMKAPVELSHRYRSPNSISKTTRFTCSRAPVAVPGFMCTGLPLLSKTQNSK